MRVLSVRRASHQLFQRLCYKSLVLKLELCAPYASMPIDLNMLLRLKLKRVFYFNDGLGPQSFVLRIVFITASMPSFLNMGSN